MENHIKLPVRHERMFSNILMLREKWEERRGTGARRDIQGLKAISEESERVSFHCGGKEEISRIMMADR